MVVVTRGEKGADIITPHKYIHVPSVTEQARIVSLNGAGDAFAAGFLFGYLNGYTLEKAGELGAKTAQQVIYQVGARPERSLAFLSKQTY